MCLVFIDTDKALDFVCAPEYRKEFLYSKIIHSLLGDNIKVRCPGVTQIVTVWTDRLLQMNVD